MSDTMKEVLEVNQHEAIVIEQFLQGKLKVDKREVAEYSVTFEDGNILDILVVNEGEEFEPHVQLRLYTKDWQEIDTEEAYNFLGTHTISNHTVIIK